MTAKEMENLLHEKIPISKEMKMTVQELTSQSLKLLMPLKPNKNHVETLFGGSLYSGGALACYGLFLATIKDHGQKVSNIVAAEGHIFYRAPVEADCVVEAQWGPETSQEDFFKNLARRKKAKIEMKAQVKVGDKVCAEFSAQFVARI